MSWYDCAEIYDIAFSWEIEPELDFLREVWNLYGHGKLDRIYEPFCGSGRLLVPLAEAGYECVGTDLSSAMLKCLQAKIGERELAIAAHQADVCTYQCAPPADMVVTLIDSFRHLITAESASAAIDAFSHGIRSGGLLVIGIQVGDAPVEIDGHAAWTMERDGLSVDTMVFSLRLPGPEPGTDLVRAVMQVNSPDGETEEIISDDPMRLYSRESLIALVHENGMFELQAAFDFHDLDSNRPTETDEPGGNSVFVFRRV